MADQVCWADLEKWLCGELAAKLPPEVLPDGWTVVVEVREPQPRPEGLFVLVHDDGGPRDLATRDHSIRIRIVGPLIDTQGALTGGVARLIDLILSRTARVEPGNPVAAFLGSQGVVRVPNTDSGRVEFLLVAQLREAGTDPDPVVIQL